MKLWIGNIEPGTSDEEIRELVAKYAPGLQCTAISRVEGDGSRPAAVLEFESPALGALDSAAMRLHGMYWKQRQLVVQKLLR